MLFDLAIQSSTLEVIITLQAALELDWKQIQKYLASGTAMEVSG